MLGVSNSIFNEAGGLVKDWLKNPLNASFFYWYFLPAVGFVFVQGIFIWPLRGLPAPEIFAGEVTHSSSLADLVLQILGARVFALIMVPLVFAVVLSALAGTIFRLYQGTLPLARVLFRPWLARNQKQSAELYATLAMKRREYLFLVSQGIRFQTVDGKEVAQSVPESERAELTDHLKAEIQALHERLEQNSSARDLPVDVDRVGATRLANTLAVAEEYPFERYSMDTAVFWPRLSAEMEPETSKTVTATFASMNGLLNLSLLSYLCGIECFAIAAAYLAGVIPGGISVNSAWLWLAGAVALVSGFALYRAAVRTARSVGDALRTAFDYYRENVLRRFNLRMPKDIEEERVVWLKLGAFIRRGESFYYPTEYRRE